MALTLINVGSVPNDGTGDNLRAAFQKTNTAFAAVDALGTSKADAATPVIGTWSAASGTFPAGSVAGKRYRVTTGGTVNSVVFVAEDILNALLTGASTTIYAGNWQVERGGNVTGPATSTANSLVRWSGTTGRVLLDGLVTINDPTMAAASSSNISVSSAVKEYVDNAVSLETAINDLPNGTIVETHGGADDTLMLGWREGVGMVSVRPNEGAFLAADPELAPATISTATYTILASDHGKRLRFSHATPAITIGTQAAQTYPDGFWCSIRSVNAYTLTCASGVDGNDVNAKVFAGLARPAVATIEKIASNDWDVLGGLS